MSSRRGVALRKGCATEPKYLPVRLQVKRSQNKVQLAHRIAKSRVTNKRLQNLRNNMSGTSLRVPTVVLQKKRPVASPVPAGMCMLTLRATVDWTIRL